jgi:hypothetical protein
VPTLPTTPNFKLNLGLALLMGRGCGSGWLPCARCSTPASGQRPTSKSRRRTRTPAHRAEQSAQTPLREAFRRLRTKLQVLDIANGLKTIVVPPGNKGPLKTATQQRGLSPQL